jgi:hypothetical protein
MRGMPGFQRATHGTDRLKPSDASDSYYRAADGSDGAGVVRPRRPQSPTPCRNWAAVRVKRDGPADGGFDCSGLTTARLRRYRDHPTAHRAGPAPGAVPAVPAGQPLQPANLVFYGGLAASTTSGSTSATGRWSTLPASDRPSGHEPNRWAGDDYAGASRPTNRQLPYHCIRCDMADHQRSLILARQRLVWSGP